MTDIEKAREWANRGEHLVGIIHPDAKAAMEIIQSLPDQWVDAEKLRDVVDKYEGIDAISVIIQNFADLLTPKSSIKPEDVPANEPWLIEVDNEKAIGTRYARDSVIPWSIALLDGSFSGDYHDNEITLIHKLVPEPPALPEGMRLADHEEYGRVVVSPGVDTDGDHKFLRSDSNNMTGASWGYANKGTFTFLDGDQHV